LNRRARRDRRVIIDGLVKSRFHPVFVIPAKAGIQLNQAVLGSRLRGSDGFSIFYEFIIIERKKSHEDFSAHPRPSFFGHQYLCVLCDLCGEILYCYAQP
jgi:hypothetical protein